jgi:CubicO group peptidase (beta-lactamase class C family)
VDLRQRTADARDFDGRHVVEQARVRRTGRQRGRRSALALVGLTLALLAVTALTPAAQAATKYRDTIRFGKQEAQKAFEDSGGASMSLALVAGDRVVWRQTYGYADVAARLAPGPDTMYGIGSVSKVIAAMAVMKLVDEGRVDLDAPVVGYVPSFRMLSPAYADITVRMLLDHSSGLPGTTWTNWSAAEYFAGYHQQVLDSLATQWLKATPGAWSVYCNDGFTLAEMVVESVTGQSYPDYVESAVFAPLKMRHSTFPMQPFAEGTYAHSYYADGQVRPREAVDLLASGGVYSTPSDMARLARMFLHGGELDGIRVLSRQAVEEMGRDQTVGTFDPAPSSMMRYGLGWDTVTEPALGHAGVTGWAKNGGSDQYGASILVAPREKLAMFACGSPVVTQYLDGLTRDVLLHALRERGTIARLPRKAPTTAPAPARASAAQIDAMTGCWANMSAVLRITHTPGRPQALTSATLSDGRWVQGSDNLRMRTDGRFHSDGGPVGFKLVRAGNRTYLDGTFAGIDGYSRTSLLLYQKLAARTPLSAAWQRRDGGVWLAVNEQPDSVVYDAGYPVLKVASVPGLPGYVATSVYGGGSYIGDATLSDDVAQLFLQIPGNFGRDQEDLFVVPRGGEEWTRWAATLFRPLATVPALLTGANSVTIGAEGYAEWREVQAAATLHVSGASAWYLYDGDTFEKLGKGAGEPADVSAPAGAYLVVFGAASSSVSVTTTPAG